MDKLSLACMPEADFNPSSLHSEKIMRLLAKSSGRAFGFMPDDGKGKPEVFRVENFELAPSKTDPGFFFGGDSYVIKYTYLKNKRENYIIYMWQVCACHAIADMNFTKMLSL